MWNKINAFLSPLVLLAVLMAVPAQAGGASPTAAIQKFYDVLTAVMKDGKSLGFSGRHDRLKPVIEEVYNLPLMARLSIGPQWPSLTPTQQEQFTSAFGEFTVSTYASRFDDYSGERFEVSPQPSSSANGQIVATKLLRTDGDPVTLNYLMRETDGGWQIVDVFLSGTISELATRRSEFTSVLRRDGPEALVQLLQRRAADLKKP